MKNLSINLGLLGHVDSGKTSLAKCLSFMASTACFDKNPQSQERGITIDLGFSLFRLEASDDIKKFGYDMVQYTLVDCPGHASLIRTVIGGAQIIDIVLLLVDITKGIQTQTAECLIIAEVMQKPIIVVLNKTDLIPENSRQSTINKISQKIRKTLSNTSFQNSPITAISTKVEDNNHDIKPYGIPELLNLLKENTFIPERFPMKPLILSVDHCFLIKGKGTIMTGTVLQGMLKVNDELEIPALKLNKKVKSIQMFKKDMNEAYAGDRIGVCVTQFNPSLLERGIACKPGTIHILYGVIIKINKISYFKSNIMTGQKYHVSIGHETTLAKITLFSSLENNELFSIENEYLYEKEYDIENNLKITFALLEFEKSVYAPNNSLLVCSKFDVDIQTNTCRLAFYGKSQYDINDINYQKNLLPKLLIYKCKQKIGNLQRICNNNEIIGTLFKKQSKINEQFLNLKVKLTTGEYGTIESSFGQGGKVKIKIPNGLNNETIDRIKSSKINSLNCNYESIKFTIDFKKYIFDKTKKLIQNE